MSGAPRCYSGSCLCGAVRYELATEFGPIEVCYCQMCRKASGGPLATNDWWEIHDALPRFETR